MSDPDEVRTALTEHGYDPREVERNRTRYRAFLHPEGVDRDGVETALHEAFGEETVFGLDLAEELWGDDDVPVKVVSFRLR